MKKLYTFIALLTLLSACVDQLEFEVPRDAPRTLIIDGFIHNLNGPHKVKVSYSAPFVNDLDGGIEQPIEDAKVIILDDLGVSYQMFHEGNGIYSSTYSYKGEVGRSYKVNVKVGDKTYESAFSQLPEPPMIDEVYYETATIQIIEDGIVKPRRGLQFYADFNYNNTSGNYLIDWDGTYMFPSLVYTFSDIVCTKTIPGPSVCYVPDSGSGWVDVFSNADNTVQGIKRVPISFTEVDRRFLIKYSYNVRLYSTDLAGFQFHDLVHKQSAATGSIFDPTPAQINGNLYNVDDPDEVVFGYFGAFGASEKRLFIEPDEIPFEIDNSRPTACAPNVGQTQGNIQGPEPWCCDCLFWPNSTSNRPIYWE